MGRRTYEPGPHPETIVDILAVLVIVLVIGTALIGEVWAQEPKVETNYYVTSEDLLKFATNLEATAPPGMEDFYDKGYYGDPLIYCVNGHDFDIWIVPKDGAVTVPAKGSFVLTRKN